MDKDNVEACAPRSHYNLTQGELDAYTQRVRDDYRAELLAGSGEPVAWRDPTNLSPGQGCTYKKSKHDGWPHIYKEPLYTADQLAAAVLRATEQANARANASWKLMCEKMVQAEREECAILAEQCEDQDHAARMIRARGNE